MNLTARRIAAECLLLRSRRMARVTTRIYLDHMHAHGLSVAQFTLLTAIGSHPGARAVDLSPALDLEKSTLSRELAPLLAAGLLEARPIDKRSTGLFLTDAGAARLEAALPSWEAAQAEARAALGPLAPDLLELFAE
jgi:DNA-binding MarR family transcriptional regulator